MSEKTYTRAEVVRIVAEVGRRTGWNVLEHAFDAFPELRVQPRSPITFEQQAAAVKRPSGIVPALTTADTDPSMPIPTPPTPRPSER